VSQTARYCQFFRYVFCERALGICRRQSRAHEGRISEGCPLIDIALAIHTKAP
jgi:hypothetical protein